MVSLQDSLVSSSSRKMPIRVRSDLTAQRQAYLGRSYWVVKDPVGLKYFRFQDEEYAILKMLDGTRSLDEIKEAFEEEFPPQKITLEELQNFIGMLHQSGLILAGVQKQGQELKKRRDKQRRQEIIGAMSNVLCIRFKGFDPERILTWLYPKVRWFFHPAVTIFCLAICAAALGLVLVEFDQFRSKLPGFYTFFNPRNFIFLGITLAVTKVVHEFGHGLACKHFGGECHEMGVMILVLTPCLYCNVSDSWMLPNKWHRAAIGIAGVYVECVMAAICTFIWWFTEPGLLHYTCLNVMFIASVTSIFFNLNPLLRYDGYYILSDIVEIPNLRQKATKILSRKAGHWFLGIEPPEDPFLPQRNQGFFAFYSIAAVVYRWFILASILFFLYKVFEPYGLKILGQLIAAMSLYGLIVMPLWKIGKFFYVPGRIHKVKKTRFFLTLAAVAGIIAFIVFYPLPHSVFAPLHLKLQDEAEIVRVPAVGGRLLEVYVRPGDQVDAGQVLARLKNTDLRLEILALKEQKNKFETQLANLRRRRASDAQAEFNIPPLEAALKMINNQIAEKQWDLADLEIKAQHSGTVIPPAWQKKREDDQSQKLASWWGTPLQKKNQGAYLEPSTNFCEIGNPNLMKAEVIIDESDIDFVGLGQEVEMMLEQLPGVVFRGEVIKIEENEMDAIPLQLSTNHGGDIPTEADPETGQETPNKAKYRAIVLLDNAEGFMQVGMTGQAKIHTPPQTLARRAVRFINETFSFTLN